MNILLINGVLLTLAIVLFTRGFLLMRLEIEKLSPPCKSDINTKSSNDECWKISAEEIRYKKLVIIIIDALRYDFASFQPNNGMPDLPFHNKMPIFHDLMQREGCTKARLWRFWADAPTTTMQRLKGLTTGSLPTFIDLSKNFASTEITEDNLLDQFRASGKNITFMGDDTWMNLFPGRFNKAYPYPSFDVKDLHTVDNGIMRHLLPEITLGDSQLLIAHFLGVDHCGHRYGPFHPEMPLKLLQMNNIVKEVVNSIDNETLLLVMGDHGMTYTGDHGGETFNEVNAALFAYNSAGKFKDCDANVPKDPLVNQVDIVPTISFLLGTSVPFANLGIVIRELIPYDFVHNIGEDDSLSSYDETTIESFYVNAKQVHTYIQAYQQASKGFPQGMYQNLTENFQKLEELYEKRESMESRDAIVEKIESFLTSARLMCREVWAQFDVLSMLAGINAAQLLIIANLLYLTTPNFQSTVKKIMCVFMFLTSLSVAVSFVTTSQVNTVFCLISCVSSFITIISLGSYSLWKSYGVMSLLELLSPTLILLMYAISLTANSFILNEDISTLYLSLSLLACLVSVVIYNNNLYSSSTKQRKNSKQDNIPTSEHDVAHLTAKIANIRKKKPAKNLQAKSNGNNVAEKPSLVTLENIHLILLSLGSMFCARFAISFRYCRAEQFWCFDENQERNNSNIESGVSSSEYDSSKLILSCFSLTVCVALFLWTLKKEGNLRNSFAFNVFLCWKIATICVICIICSWILLITPPKLLIVLPTWCITMFPRIVYVALMLFLIILFVNPVFASILYPDGYGGYSESPPSSRISSKRDAVSHMFNKMKEKMNEDLKQSSEKSEDQSKDTPPIAFGLYTVLSASILSILLCMIILFFMLLGPEKSTSLLLWIFASGSVLEMTAIIMQQKNTIYVPWISVVTWGFLSCFWWFSTGHQASVSSIQWDAAFVGFQGSHPSKLIPAVLVLLNTFCMQILSTVSLPLLMLWPLTRGKWYSTAFAENTSSELLCYKNKEKFYSTLNDLFVKYLSFHTVKILGCMVCACLHRRHLMVWQIFAPRYMFEGVSLIVIMLSCLLTYFHIENTGRKIGAWLAFMESKLQ